MNIQEIKLIYTSYLLSALIINEGTETSSTKIQNRGQRKKWLLKTGVFVFKMMSNSQPDFRCNYYYQISEQLQQSQDSIYQQQSTKAQTIIRENLGQSENKFIKNWYFAIKYAKQQLELLTAQIKEVQADFINDPSAIMLGHIKDVYFGSEKRINQIKNNCELELQHIVQPSLDRTKQIMTYIQNIKTVMYQIYQPFLKRLKVYKEWKSISINKGENNKEHKKELTSNKIRPRFRVREIKKVILSNEEIQFSEILADVKLEKFIEENYLVRNDCSWQFISYKNPTHKQI